MYLKVVFLYLPARSNQKIPLPLGSPMAGWQDFLEF